MKSAVVNAVLGIPLLAAGLAGNRRSFAIIGGHNAVTAAGLSNAIYPSPQPKPGTSSDDFMKGPLPLLRYH